MMNSKTFNQPRKGDKMTNRQHVSMTTTSQPIEFSEHYEKKLEQSKYDPLIAAYDFRWNELFRKPLSKVEGMAYGVREDFLNGKVMLGGFVGNQCPDAASSNVCFWALVE